MAKLKQHLDEIQITLRSEKENLQAARRTVGGQWLRHVGFTEPPLGIAPQSTSSGLLCSFPKLSRGLCQLQLESGPGRSTLGDIPIESLSKFSEKLEAFYYGKPLIL